MKSIYFQSVIKMSNKEEQQRTPCVLEISDKGIKMVDKSKPGVRFTTLHSWLWGQNIMHWQDGNGVPSNEYFYNLKNVTFCGFHPRDHRYFGFITKVRDHTCDVWRVLTCRVAAPQPVSAAVRVPRVPGRVEHAVRGPGLRVSHLYCHDMSWWYSAAGEPSDASTRSLSRQLSPRRIFIWSRSTECHPPGASGAAARWELHFPRDVFIHPPSEAWAWTRILEASCPHSDIDIVMETQLWCRCQPESATLGPGRGI